MKKLKPATQVSAFLIYKPTYDGKESVSLNMPEFAIF